MDCPKCGTVLRRSNTSSEPEEIRADAFCLQCQEWYAVHKAGYVRLPLGPHGLDSGKIVW